jgi:hypothetical protein
MSLTTLDLRDNVGTGDGRLGGTLPLPLREEEEEKRKSKKTKKIKKKSKEAAAGEGKYQEGEQARQPKPKTEGGEGEGEQPAPLLAIDVARRLAGPPSPSKQLLLQRDDLYSTTRPYTGSLLLAHSLTAEQAQLPPPLV